MKLHRITKAIILAAGKSTRFGSNKLIEPILGKSTIQYCVEFCIDNNIKDCYITINKSDFYFKNNTILTHPIIEALSQYKDKISIYYEFQNENEYGPGAAIKVWKDKVNESFLCLFGDNFYKGDLGLDFIDPNRSICSFKDYDKRARNLQLATIIDNIVVEKPHGVVSGRYFCGYMIFNHDAFSKLDSIKMSSRGEYEITHLINAMKDVQFEPLTIDWYDLTYEEDKFMIEQIIKNINAKNNE